MIAKSTIATDPANKWHSPAMRNDVRLISGRHVLAKFVNRKGIGTPYLTGPSDFPDGRILKQKFTTTPDAMCQPGDILVTVKGSGAGKIVVADDHYCISRQLMAVRVERWNADYLYYALSKTAGVLQDASTGLIPGLSRSDILGQLIEMPSCPDEQRAIAAALSDADALIAALERLIAKKRDIKQGAMQELLTGKRRLPGFEGAWETHCVRDLIRSHYCGPSPTCEERQIADDAEWGVLKTTAMPDQGVWDWTKHKVLPKSFWGLASSLVRVGDVVVTKAGPRHRVGVAAAVDHVPDRIIASGKMIGLRLETKTAEPRLLACAIASKETQLYLDQRTTGMAESQVNFENEALLSAPVQLPRVEEQRAIATILADMDAEIAALDSRLTKARDIKQGMMQQLLTGRIRLA